MVRWEGDAVADRAAEATSRDRGRNWEREGLGFGTHDALVELLGDVMMISKTTLRCGSDSLKFIRVDDHDAKGSTRLSNDMQ